jgi:hypothetical protein
MQRSAFDDARVDTLPLGDADDLVDGLVERLLPGHHSIAAVLLGHPVPIAGNQSGQPAAVAP